MDRLEQSQESGKETGEWDPKTTKTTEWDPKTTKNPGNLTRLAISWTSVKTSSYDMCEKFTNDNDNTKKIIENKKRDKYIEFARELKSNET